MTAPMTLSPHVQAALDTVDADAFTKRSDGTRVPQSSSPTIIATMLDLLDIEPGACVLEIGTGSGYSTALLTQLVGDHGHITSVDIDPALSARAEQLLQAHAYHNADLITGDGVKGAPGFRGHFDHVIAWTTVDQIPGDWITQATPGAIIVAPVNLTGLAKTHAVVRARYDDTVPSLAADTLIPGGFVEAHDQILNQWLVPPRGVDILARDDDHNPWWLSARWLRTDDSQQHGRELLNQLITDARTVPGPLTVDENGTDFYAYLLATRPDGLTTAALGNPTWRIEYSDPTGAALIPTEEGQNTVHASDHTALDKLTGWTEHWRELGRPGYTNLRPHLDQDEHGWHVRGALSA